MENNNGWIGVDLDGTLAYYTEWQGPQHIGVPIPLMLQRIHQWIYEGKTVKIFTARAAFPEYIPYVKAWLSQYGIGHLEITNIKDFEMVELWDDKCKQVIKNTGVPILISTNNGGK